MQERGGWDNSRSVLRPPAERSKVRKGISSSVQFRAVNVNMRFPSTSLSSPPPAAAATAPSSSSRASTAGSGSDAPSPPPPPESGGGGGSGVSPPPPPSSSSSAGHTTYINMEGGLELSSLATPTNSSTPTPPTIVLSTSSDSVSTTAVTTTTPTAAAIASSTPTSTSMASSVASSFFRRWPGSHASSATATPPEPAAAKPTSIHLSSDLNVIPETPAGAEADANADDPNSQHTLIPSEASSSPSGSILSEDDRDGVEEANGLSVPATGAAATSPVPAAASTATAAKRHRGHKGTPLKPPGGGRRKGRGGHGAQGGGAQSQVQRPCQTHSFHTDAAEVQDMEKGLLKLLDDFNSGRLRAFGQGCSMEQMEQIRDQQESLAKLHFELGARQDVFTPLSEDGLRSANENMDKLMQRLETLSVAIGQLNPAATTDEEPNGQSLPGSNNPGAAGEPVR